jgi:hypothetical protein
LGVKKVGLREKPFGRLKASKKSETKTSIGHGVKKRCGM